MSRCRFVQPETVRLSLVDVHKRALIALDARPPTKKADEKQWREDARRRLTVLIADGTADGHFIDIKKELTAGETRYVYTYKLLQGERSADLSQVLLNKLATYIVGWSLTDAEGKPVPPSESALENLDTQTYDEMRQAVEAHEDAAVEERAARKNEQGTPSESAAT